MKITIKNIIKENNTPEEKYINGISNMIRTPYFYNLRVNEVPKELWVRILSKIFNQEVSVSNNSIYDENNNQIYFEGSFGNWIKREYDKNNNGIYYENSNGDWVKREYDGNDNEIYYENSDGYIIDNRPSSSINENIDITPEEKYINGIVNFIKLPYFYNLRVNEVPEELWDRILSKIFNQEVSVSVSENYIYNSNNNKIYLEDSNGFWVKREFDKNNNQIYYENSNGYIVDNRLSNPLNENIDITPEEKYINGISNMIRTPYFYNLRVNEVPEELWDRILLKIFNQEVSVSNNGIYDSNNNKIYFENSNGYWYKQEFDKNNNGIYLENSTGDWEKREYDKNNNVIYYENSNGYWWKREYDKNNNEIYFEDSDGYWEKQEFDKNNNLIYYESSYGTIRDNRPISSINENIDITPEEKYINGLSNFIKPPYFYNLRVNEVPEELWVRILSKIFNQEVEVSVRGNGIYDKNYNRIYYEHSDGHWVKREFDSNNNQIYSENSDGHWWKREYDKNNNEIYYENSDGYIIDNRPSNPLNENIDPEEKFINGIVNFIKLPYFYNLRVNEVPRELWVRILSKIFNQEVREYNNSIYDENNNKIYYEDSDGDWWKREYDENNNKIYYENSDGYWWKREYDKNNNQIYFENSNGDWEKREYDSNNNLLYREDSTGYIMDNRPSSSINENIDITPEEKFIDGISNMIRIPYFYNLRVNEVPRELWVRILSKIFNQEVSVSENYIYNSNNNPIYYENSFGNWIKREYDGNDNEIYYENSDGYWVKREYDKNNNVIYYENSDGYWWKHEYDSNNNQIYHEDLNGYWWKREFDSNNNVIYRENSDGKIMDNRPSNPLNENIDLTPEEKFINGLSNFIKPPYFYNLRVNEVPKELWVRVLSKIFNQEVISVSNNGIYDKNNNGIYFENSNGDWGKLEFDSNNNEIYYEDSTGFWWKREYDSNNNQIYYEDSDGNILDDRSISSINENIDPKQRYIDGLSNMIRIPYFYNLRVNEVPEKLWGRVLSKIFNQEVSVSNNSIYDSNNNEIYYENSDGDWRKQEFDKNKNPIYYENSDGYWWKREYDKNNNPIYYENSNGYWWKREYDKNNNEIYFEDSDGIIIDYRPSNPLNENIDPEEKFINGISNFIRTPYFYNLRVNEVPRELWNEILSKVYYQEVSVSGNYIFDKNNNLLYYEDSDGDWGKREFDKNDNEIYFENSNGYWEKQEYDSNNNQIYFENSNGDIRDNRPSNPLNENIDLTPEEKYINGISNFIKLPYFNFLRVNEVPRELWNEILSKVYSQEVSVSENYIYDSNNNEIYYEDSTGFWWKREYDSNNNQIYYENSDGDWSKREYDENNNQIYFENSNGNWVKREYDGNDNEIYYENSDGKIIDNRPISSINENNTI